MVLEETLPPEEAEYVSDEEDKTNVGRKTCGVTLPLDLEALDYIA